MPYECFIRVKAKGNFFIFFILNSLQALVASEFGVCMQLSKQFRPKNVLEKTQLKFCVELSSPNFCPQRHSPWLSAVRGNWIRRFFLRQKHCSQKCTVRTHAPGSSKTSFFKCSFSSLPSSSKLMMTSSSSSSPLSSFSIRRSEPVPSCLLPAGLFSTYKTKSKFFCVLLFLHTPHVH